MIRDIKLVSRATQTHDHWISILKPYRLTYNHVHNILRTFDSLEKFPITPSETMRDYYL